MKAKDLMKILADYPEAEVIFRGSVPIFVAGGDSERYSVKQFDVNLDWIDEVGDLRGPVIALGGDEQ